MRITQISRQTLQVTLAMLAGLGIALPPRWRQRLQPPAGQDARSGWVSSADLDEMYQAATRVSGKTELGLLMASTPALARHSPFLMLVLHAPDVGTALDNLLKFSALSQADCELSLGPASDPPHLAIRLMPHHVSHTGMVCRVDFLVQGLVQLIRQADASGRSIIAIRLAFEPPAHAHLYPQHLGLAPKFGAPCNEIVLTRSLLACPMPMADPLEYGHALSRAHIALAELKARRGLVREVEALLMRDLPGQHDCTAIARQMGTPLWQWLHDHAWMYGWTPYKVEPWHWEHAVSLRSYVTTIKDIVRPQPVQCLEEACVEEPERCCT